jgi:hypothetical protein
MRRQTSRGPRLRKQDLPADVPETQPASGKSDVTLEPAEDPSEDAIRKMVEAAYT